MQSSTQRVAPRPSTQETLSCPVCGADEVTLFVEVPRVPVLCNALWATREEARDVPRGDLKLGFCRHCGHVYNYAFDETLIDYSPTYENSLHFSPRFQAFADALAERLIDTYDVHDTTVIDIGCGRGDFLEALCRKGRNRGIGFDPSYDPAFAPEGAGDRFTVIQDYYSDAYAEYEADLITCRHVLEHIAEPAAFVQRIRRAVDKQRDPVVYFEVPNVLFTLQEQAIWDLIYEHCSYFSPSSLAYLFEESGFEVIDSREPFGRQYVSIDVRRRAPNAVAGGEAGAEGMQAPIQAFGHMMEEKVGRWAERVEALSGEGKKAVVWGAGSKGITFLNFLDVGEEIPAVVDLNPRKHGMHVTGTGQEIVAPAALREIQPEVVIIMNSIYREEIKGMLADQDLYPDLLEA